MPCLNRIPERTAQNVCQCAIRAFRLAILMQARNKKRPVCGNTVLYSRTPAYFLSSHPKLIIKMIRAAL